MANAAGVTAMNTNAPSAAYPIRQPHVSTANVMATGATMPANDTPTEPKASAQPRRATNHLETAELATSEPNRLYPTSPSAACRMRNAHKLDCAAIPAKQTTDAATPISISGRGPCLSSACPANTPDAAPIAPASDVPSVNCHTSHPVSSTTGFRKTPTTVGPAAIHVNCETTAAATIHQP